MAFVFTLGLASWVLLYSGFKGYNPLELVASVFTGQQPVQRFSFTGAPVAARSATKVRTKGILKVAPGVAEGPEWVYLRVLQAASAAGGSYTITSWSRPGAVVKGTSKKSDHSCAKAVDVVPDGNDWSQGDALAREAQRLGMRVVFRGDADHDPALGASGPHVHISVGSC